MGNMDKKIRRFREFVRKESAGQIADPDNSDQYYILEPTPAGLQRAKELLSKGDFSIREPGKPFAPVLRIKDANANLKQDVELRTALYNMFSAAVMPPESSEFFSRNARSNRLGFDLGSVSVWNEGPDICVRLETDQSHVKSFESLVGVAPSMLDGEVSVTKIGNDFRLDARDSLTANYIAKQLARYKKDNGPPNGTSQATYEQAGTIFNIQNPDERLADVLTSCLQRER